MDKPFLETERCALYPFRETDVKDASVYLQDPEVMYAWEKIFSTEDIISMIHDAMEDQANEG